METKVIESVLQISIILKNWFNVLTEKLICLLYMSNNYNRNDESYNEFHNTQYKMVKARGTFSQTPLWHSYIKVSEINYINLYT